MSEHDVVVVGARLAGSTLAAELARRGRDVVVIDRARFPSDTLSTHVMFGGGIEELRHMGALDRILELDPSRMRWLQIHFGNEVTGLEFLAGLCSEDDDARYRRAQSFRAGQRRGLAAGRRQGGLLHAYQDADVLEEIDDRLGVGFCVGVGDV